MQDKNILNGKKTAINESPRPYLRYAKGSGKASGRGFISVQASPSQTRLRLSDILFFPNKIHAFGKNKISDSRVSTG